MLVVVLISRLRQKLLYALRLFLLVAILTVLTTQVYALVKPEVPRKADSEVTTSVRFMGKDFLNGFLDRLKNYYRGW